MSEILVSHETEQLHTDGSELLIEEVVRVETLVESTAEMLAEEVAAEVLVEVAAAERLIDETSVMELLEVAERGPSGPAGPPGLPGDGGLGGLEVYVQDPRPGQILALDATNSWTNQDLVVDGGNF